MGWVVGGRRSLTGCLPVADCRLTEWDHKQRSVVPGTNCHAAVESDIDVYTQVLLPCDSVGRERESDKDRESDVSENREGKREGIRLDVFSSFAVSVISFH